MSCGDQDCSVGAGYVAESVLARKVTRNDGSVSLVEDVSQRPVPNSLFSEELTTLELDTVGCVQPLGEDQMLQYNGDGVSGQWVNVQPAASLEKIFIDGKEYLLVDNSGPEERDPIKLQERIVELENELSILRSDSNSDAISFSTNGCYGGFTPNYSGYAGAECSFVLDETFDLVTVSLVSNPEEECKIVSSEEANYERAMKGI